ncbi:2-amino-4-hydroxy-6-hydroxymethyldihydropteridinediphosphokinase [Formivibrio citricus]|uniref:2-amino-4-hydroxy-6-hydroxymethyldihydropteridine pyrophosphokinase n=1 Tax=Formivibrio citricus TaxID=83765 RepID=A0A1I5ACJ9_9NEIS|nr:2-amino-4-hydroxy-6-hydroxymethyldihydropteridine diphosphokinase [Formivibrio citricus]SFN60080.1 2-amino-4-hydroxy-6-hydroxymethyldihydropteridinediphosphokinase [Formivibrio citricus]
MSVQAFIALGANLGQPAKQLRRAIALICLLPNTRLVSCSSFYSSAPVGYTDQPDFINAVVEITTKLSPHGLLEALLAIESALGRERHFSNGPRTIDLDLILYSNLAINNEALTVPHPRMSERAFVLVPLLEIAPNIIIPGQGRAEELLPRVTDQQLHRIA